MVPLDNFGWTTPSNGSKLISLQVSRMNNVSAAKTLLLRDTRKAQAIADFVRSMFMRNLVPIEDLSTQNFLIRQIREETALDLSFCVSSETRSRYITIFLINYTENGLAQDGDYTEALFCIWQTSYRKDMTSGQQGQKLIKQYFHSKDAR